MSDKAIIEVKCPKCGKEYNVVYGKITAVNCPCGEKIPIKPEEKKKGKTK